MIGVSYGGNKYYVTDKEGGDSQVYNFKYQKLSLKEIRGLNFQSRDQFVFFLRELSLKHTRLVFHTQETFRTVLSENLKHDCPLPYSATRQLLSGVNYKILKVGDLSSTLSLLEKIKMKHPHLQFVHVSFPSDKSLKQVPKTVQKYVTSPLGKMERGEVFTLPLLLPLVLKHL